MKVVINGCYGGFSLSAAAEKRFLELGGKFENSSRDIERNDPLLVQVVEEMGAQADGFCAKLRIVEIPDDVQWHVAEYDGSEWIAENHRTWG